MLSHVPVQTASLPSLRMDEDTVTCYLRAISLYVPEQARVKSETGLLAAAAPPPSSPLRPGSCCLFEAGMRAGPQTAAALVSEFEHLRTSVVAVSEGDLDF